MDKLYLRFLQLASVIQQGSLSQLDETSVALLNDIALAHAQGAPLTVSQAMGLENIASATTIHRKLDELRIAGYIEQIFQGSNRRTKYLVPTARTHAYVQQMSEAMAKATLSTPAC